MGKAKPAARIEYNAGFELQAFPLERLVHPFDVLPRWGLEPELPDLKRDDLERGKISGRRFDIREIHKRQIAAILFVSADSFIIIAHIAAAIKNEPLMVDLDGLGMMR